MRRLSFAHDEAVDRLVDQIRGFTAAAGAPDELGLLAPSRCQGWSRLEVVVHVRMGLEEMAIATTSRTSAVPDHDAASYWGSHPDDRDFDPVPHVMWLRRTASAYGRPSAAVTHLGDVAERAVVAVRTMPESVVAWQGKVMTSGDFLGTWVAELAVHQLDLALESEVADRPSGLDWTRATLEAVADADLPEHLDDRTAVLAGLGRTPPPPGAGLPPGFPVSL